MNPAAAAVRDERSYWALAVLVALVWLATLGLRPLFNPDEGRYAEIPREMLAGGDWVVPHLNGLAYIEKPPLQYWGTALSLRVFGGNAFAARLYTALCALATVGVVGFTGRRLWGIDAGWRAAGALGGMLMFVVLGQLLTLDMSLTCYLTLGLAAFLLAQKAARPQRLMLLAWAAAACGMLTKGLVAPAIPAAVLILYSAYSRDFAPWRRLNIKQGLPLFILLTLPWHWLAARRLPEFLQFYFVREHFARYLTPIADRQESWWFFIALFLAGSVPWTVSVLRALCIGWRRSAAPRAFNPALFLWIWVIFVLVFFSLSDSKLMPYILPSLPAAALLIAALPPQALKRDFSLTAALTVAVGLGLGAASLVWPSVIASSAKSVYFMPLSKPLMQVALLLAASGVFVLLCCKRSVTRAAVFLGAGWCLAWLLLLRAAALLAPVYSGQSLAQALPASERSAPLYSVGSYDQSLTFYLQRSVTLVGYRGELDFGLNQTPEVYVASVQDFIHLWIAQSRSFAVMEKGVFNDLSVRGVPMRLIAQNYSRVLVARK